MKRIRLLLVEDEPGIAQVIKETLDTKGFDILIAANGLEGWSLYKNGRPEICVVDIMMPKKDGLSLIEDIRAADTEIPIIVLTAKTSTADVIKGLEAGADDYMKKPFSMEELILRVRNLTRRAYKGIHPAPLSLNALKVGGYHFDHHRLLLSFGDETTNLSQRESDLLMLLMLYKDTLLDRKTALLKIWGDDSFFNARSMDVFISKLRKYLQKDPRIQIVNVRGKGYRLII